MLRWMAAVLLFTGALLATTGRGISAQDPDESADRVFAEAFGWIYDDLDAGLQLARKSGQPLMVVIRCPP